MTSAERWQRTRELLDETLGLPPDARSAWLSEATQGDAGLEAEVLALLAHVVEDDPFLEEPPVLQGLPSGDAEGAGAFPDAGSAASLGAVFDRVGPYRLVRRVGEGGMGVVWEAERADDTFRMRVAVKLVKRGMDSEAVLRRFQREREILARLEHPNIARLLDGGIAPDGRPWFALEFVEGSTVTEYCAAEAISETARLLLFREVCGAVHFAHRNLVVHRDLKPSNILVGPDGVPKLLDFGVARLLDPGIGDGDAPDDLTRVGGRPLTPAYASPEQAAGRPVTTASDVHALGIVLHEVLTGSRPGRDGAVAPSLPRDLGTIVQMAIREDPERRYPSAWELSEDIRRYLEGFPVMARPDTVVYRVRKFVGRNRLAVGAAAVGVLAVIAAGSAAVLQGRVAISERARAEARAADLRAISTSLLFDVHDAIAQLPGATAARELVVRQAFEHLERLDAAGTGDPALARDVAEGYLRLAGVLANPTGAGMADRDGARAALERAVPLAEAWVDRHGESLESVALLADAYRRWGDFLAWEGEVERGVEMLERGRAAHERAAALAGPEDEAAHLEVVISHVKVGDHTGHRVFRNLGDPEGALERYELALAVLDAPPLAGSTDWRVRRFRGLLDERVGALQRTLGDPASALDSFGRSLALRMELALEDPNHLDALRDEAIGHQLVCEVLVDLGRPEEGAPGCARALDRFRDLRDRDPDNRGAHVDLAVMQASYAQVLERAGDREGARRATLEAIRTRESILELDPGNTVNPGVLEQLRGRLAALGAGG
jgi:eukaryotic-like serine/threonine-protein kinase